MANYLVRNGKVFSTGQIQWAPLLYSHDPAIGLTLTQVSPISGTVALALGVEANLGGWRQRGGGRRLQPFVGLQSKIGEKLGSDQVFGSAAPSAISGTVSLALGASAPGTGVGALAGSVALTLGASTSASGVGALAGSVALSLGATMQGTISALAGTVALSFGGNSTLSAPTGILAGSASLSFGSGSSALTGAGALAGTAAQTIVPTARFDLIAREGMSLGATGTLTGLAPISGVVPMVFQYADTSTLSAASRPGSIVLTLGASGTLTPLTARGIGLPLHQPQRTFYSLFSDVSTPLQPQVKDLGVRTAVAAMQFGSGASLLTGAGALAGTCVLTFGGTSQLRGTGALAGASALTFVPTVQNGLSGTVVLSLSATMTSPGAMAGTCALALGEGTSTLSGIGGMASNPLLTFGATASVADFGLRGTISISFDLSMGPRWRGIGTPLRKGVNSYTGSPAALLAPGNTNATQLVASGPVVMALTPTGTMRGDGALAGTCTLVLGAGGVMDGSTQSSITMQLSLTVTPRGIGALAGTCNLLFGANPSLIPQLPVIGTSGMMLTLVGRLDGLGAWVQNPPAAGGWTASPASGGNWTKKAPVAGSWTQKTGT